LGEKSEVLESRESEGVQEDKNVIAYNHAGRFLK
jgi:hypothetical protein